METIGAIKEALSNTPEKELQGFIDTYAQDERGGIIKLVETARKRLAAYEKEVARMEGMKTFERKYADHAYICGIDEVGRGPLAGPVVTGAVILPKDCDLLYINDSKQLSEKRREELYDRIMETAVAVAVGFNPPARIDEINILQANYEAMREAISKLSVKPDLLLNDAVTIAGVDIR